MLINSYNYDEDDDDSNRAKYDNDFLEDMKEEYEKYVDITKIEYFPTTLNIYFLINGDLNISEKIAFQYNMLTKDMRLSSKTFYLLKNTRFNNYAIENAGYNANDEEIFTKDYKFESIMKYVNEKNKNIKRTEKEIKDNINENVAFILNRFFSYKREIKIKNKEYLIAKYKILHVRGIVHIIADNFFDIRYKDDKPTFELKKISKLINEKKNYEKNILSKKNNEINSINITIDLTLLDKSKNPSSLDFINTSCLDKRMNIKDTYDKLLFSLFGVNLKKDDQERIRRYNKLFYYNLKKNKETQKEKEKIKKENERKDKLFKNFNNLIGYSDDEKKEKKEGGKKIRKTKKLTKRNQKNTRKKKSYSYFFT